jgi:hypothetical protein
MKRAAYAGGAPIYLTEAYTHELLSSERNLHRRWAPPGHLSYFQAEVSTVIGTGLIGWLLNIVLVLCSGPIENLPGPSESAFLTILVLRLGKTGALILWVRLFLTSLGSAT